MARPGSEAADPRLGYRNRLRLQVVDGRADFFNTAKRNGCLVVRPELLAGVDKLRSLTAVDPRLLAGVTHLEARVGDAAPTGVDLGLALSHAVDHEPLRAALGPDWLIASPGPTTDGESSAPATLPVPALPYLVTSDGCRVMVPLTSFVQVNSAVNRQMVDEVVAIADASGAETFLDLFSGAGNFAIPIGATGRAGVAIDNSGPAIHRLGADAPGHITAIEGDARTKCGELEPADLVVIDPPRAGVQQNHDVMAGLARKTLILIGCRLSSFAADVAEFQRQGMTLRKVRVFNMFPGTAHMETMAVMTPEPPFAGPTPGDNA